jgi:hypothetical protein
MELTDTQHNVLVAMLQQSLDRTGEYAYPVRDDWKWVDDKRVDIPATTSWEEGERIKLAQADGDALVEAGMVEYIDSGTLRYQLTPEGICYGLPHVTGYTPLDPKTVIEDTLDSSYFHPVEELEGETPIPFLYKPSESGSKLVLVLGENAGGKSFFRRVLRAMTARQRKGSWGNVKDKDGPYPVGEFIHLSMEGRCQSGIPSAMVYGTEEWRSTGENSTNTVAKGISTARSRAHTSVLYWDEPDIGMGNAAAAGAALDIRDFLLADDTPLIQMVCITSHSVALLKQFVDLDPHYIYLGNDEGPATFEEWFVAQENPVPVRPRELMDRSHKRFKMIQTILNRNKKRR